MPWVVRQFWVSSKCGRRIGQHCLQRHPPDVGEVPPLVDDDRVESVRQDRQRVEQVLRQILLEGSIGVRPGKDVLVRRHGDARASGEVGGGIVVVVDGHPRHVGAEFSVRPVARLTARGPVVADEEDPEPLPGQPTDPFHGQVRLA